MPCNNCGSTVELVDSSGGTTEGKFQEKYQCVGCGRRGYISGDASKSPQSWNKYGGLYE